jgi:hypothetical protein
MLRFAGGARLFQLWKCGFEALLVRQRTKKRSLLKTRHPVRHGLASKPRLDSTRSLRRRENTLPMAGIRRR